MLDIRVKRLCGNVFIALAFINTNYPSPVATWLLWPTARVAGKVYPSSVANRQLSQLNNKLMPTIVLDQNTTNIVAGIVTMLGVSNVDKLHVRGLPICRETGALVNGSPSPGATCLIQPL